MKKNGCIQRFLVLIFLLALTPVAYADFVITDFMHDIVKWGIQEEREAMTLLDSAPPKTLVIPRIKKEPRIDGKLDDACWTTASECDFFTAVKGFNVKPQLRWGIDRSREKLNVKICYDDRFLYMAITAQEPLLCMLKPNMETRDSQVWKNDCIDIIFNTTGKRDRSIHTLINTCPAVYDAEESETPDYKAAGAAFNWKEMQVACQKDIEKGGLVFEIRFDFGSVGGTPREGSRWGFNLGRQRFVAEIEGVCTYSSWNGYPFGFSKCSKYNGDIVFGGMAFSETSMDTPFLGKNKIGAKVYPYEKNSELTAQVEILGSDGKLVSGKPVTVIAPAEKWTEFVLPFQIEREGCQYAMLKVTDKDGKEVFRSRLPLYVEPVSTTFQTAVAAVVENLRFFVGKSGNGGLSTEFGELDAKARALKKEIDVLLRSFAQNNAVQNDRKQWQALQDRIREFQRIGCAVIWDRELELPGGPDALPDSLRSIDRIVFRACQNEYVTRTMLITNLTRENLILAIRSAGILDGRSALDSCNLLISPPLQTSEILEKNPNALKYSMTRGWNLPGKVGEPFYRISGLGELVIPPLSTRQILAVFHVRNHLKIRQGTSFRKYNCGSFQIYPLNMAVSPHEIKLEARIDNFAIPSVADLGVFLYEYGQEKIADQNRVEHKVNQWFSCDGLTGNWNFNDPRFTGIPANPKRSLAQIKKEAARRNAYPGTRRGWGYGDFAKLQKMGSQLGGYMSAAHKDYIRAYFREFVKQLKAHGIPENEIVVQALDEAKGGQIKVVADIGRIFKEIFPGIRLALTCQISGAEREQLDGIIDFWLPAGGYVWEKGRKISEGTFWGPPLGFYDRQKDKGAVIYPYQCSVPVRSRDPLGYFRMFGWRAFNIGADGIAVFTGNDNLYHNLNEFGGELIGTRGWEAFRNGVQDWQYCHLLMQEIGRIETKNPEAAVRMKKHLERIFRKLFEAGPFPDGTAESVARVNAAKYAVADMILDARKLK